MNLFVDIHVLQTLPPSNVNRDDTGAPKTATFGGVPRHRVSSQAWKKAMRNDFPNYLDTSKLSRRTKWVASAVASKVVEFQPEFSEEAAVEAAQELFKKAGFKLSEPKRGYPEDASALERAEQTGYLMFLSNHQIANSARAIIEKDGETFTKKEAVELLDQEHSVDIAAFGRMVADDAAFNVDAAVQVAHALGVSAAEPEFDYFTAVDDVIEDREDSGAGMIGTVQMMSSTLYRYATIDVESLAKNLGGQEAAVEASLAIAKAFVTSMPTGKQNTFANRTLPDAVLVSVRKDRPISLVNAFEAVVREQDGTGRRIEAARRLAAEAIAIDEAFGSDDVVSRLVLALPAVASEMQGLGEHVQFPALFTELEKVLSRESA